MTDSTAAVSSCSAEAIVEIRGLTKRYAGVTAVDNVELVISRGEVLGIIGPNGAGKSTLVGLIGGAINPSSGTIRYAGTDITALPASERARRGIGRTYQIPRPFLDMTVTENLEVALYSASPLISARVAAGEVRAMLARTGLSGERERIARDLPLLRRKRLEIARALMLKPQLLLLDEVGAGLVDAEVSELVDLIRALNDGKTSILIIEHVIRIVRECCRRVAVLHTGAKFVEGATAEVLADKKVASIYLGTAHGSNSALPERPEAVSTAPVRAPSKVLLQLANLTAGYGQARVLTGINLEVRSGEAVAILGTNGAGKTTLANAISGMVRATGGSIHFDGRNVTNMSSHVRVRHGIAHCMEGRRIFSTLTVEENLLIAARNIDRQTREQRLDDVYRLFYALHSRRDNVGTSLSGGEQQMLAIGRSLMSGPKLIIFDEISLGLAPIMMDRLYEALQQLRRSGLTMLIIEQDVDRALELADRACVLERGRMALSGSAAEIRSDRDLRQLYLGEAG